MKPGRFTQLYVMLVFAVKGRQTLLRKTIRDRIFEYMGGINSDLKNKSIIVNGISDHVHVFYGMNPDVSVSDTVYHIKRGSSLFINEHGLCPCHFSWQEGYGAFTYCHTDLDRIYKYVQNQEIHHGTVSFKNEYVNFLKESDIDFDERFLFEFYD